MRSLDWEVAKGPLWKEDEEDDEMTEETKQKYFDIEDFGNESQQTDNLSSDTESSHRGMQRSAMAQRRSGAYKLSPAKNRKNFKSEKIRDGDYVYAPEIQGVYYVRIVL